MGLTTTTNAAATAATQYSTIPLLAVILSTIAHLFILQSCALFTTPSLATTEVGQIYEQTQQSQPNSLPQIATASNTRQIMSSNPLGYAIPFFAQPVRDASGISDVSNPLGYYSPLGSSAAFGDVYINERYEKFVDGGPAGGLFLGEGGTRLRSVPETVMQMIRRGAVEDFSVTKYQRNTNVSSLFTVSQKMHNRIFLSRV